MTHSARSIFTRAARTLLDLEALALPVACLGCGAYLPPAEAAEACCAVCRSRMRRPAPPLCPRCGQPLDPWDGAARGGLGEEPRQEDPPARCGFCGAWPDALAWAVSAVWMDDGPARELVHALKYGGWRTAARPRAAAIARGAGLSLRSVDLLVPVPLGERRLRERGYNQAAVLARALGAALGIPVAEGRLVRTRETRSQTTLRPAERWTNVTGAFRTRGGTLDGMRVAVVDDVLTPGATLAACAAALAAGGAKEAGAATFARAAVPN